MRHIIVTIFYFLTLTLIQAQSNPVSVIRDTIDTITSDTWLIVQETKWADGSTDITGISLLLRDQEVAIPDTTITLSQDEVKTVYYRKKNGLDIIFTKLPDGGRYERHRTDHHITKKDQVDILKCIYSKIIYPEKAIRRNLEDRIELEFYLNTSGCIQDIIPRSTRSQILIDEAIRAARECDCAFPVLKDGESRFPTTLMLPLKFMLQ